MIIAELLVFAVVLLTTVVLTKWRRKTYTDGSRYPPSLPSVPLVGSLPFVRNFTNISVFFMNKATELGPIFTLRVGNKFVLTLNSKDAIEKAYVKNSSAFSDRPYFVANGLVNPENKGIIFARKTKDWKGHQQFSLAILKEFGFGVKNIMETRIFKEIEALTEYVQDKNGKAFNPMEICSLATSNIIMNILFGRRREYHLGLSDVAVNVHKSAAEFNMINDILPFVQFLPSCRRQIQKFAEYIQVVMECVENEKRQSLNLEEPNFVKSYIEKSGADYDREQLNFLLRDLVGAGTDTTSTSIQWSLVALANNPEVQERLNAEICAVVPGDRLPTLQDKAMLPYVEATLLEVTRWRTLVPLSILRETSQNSVVDGYFIPGGTIVAANLYAAHHDIKVWKDPEVFRPERFLDSENNVIGRDRVIPFSIGRRSCLGEFMARAELFLIFTSLVKRFLILPPEGQKKIDEDPKLPVSAVTFPKPYKIRFIERK